MWFFPERIETAALERSRADLVPLQFLCASATQRQSTTVSCAIREAVAPLRKVVSRAAVCNTKSARDTAGLLKVLVIKTIGTPRALNSRMTSTVSTVVPECVMATKTSPLSRTAIEVIAE